MQTRIDRAHEGSWRWDPWTGVLWAISLVAISIFLRILSDILVRGLGQTSWSFIVEAPRNAGRAGGIGPILISTLLIVMMRSRSRARRNLLITNRNVYRSESDGEPLS